MKFSVHQKQTGAADGVPGGRATRWALASLSLSMLMPSLDTSIANVGLPTLARAFAAPFHSVQWIVLAYLLAIATLIVSAGRLGDLFGRRRLLQAGIGLFTTASLVCGIAPTLGVLIFARAAQGGGAAIMMALTVALVGATVPKERTGRAMGLLGTMSAVGTMLGPSLGGILIALLGWRVIFLVNVPLGILNIMWARRFLPVDRREADAPLPGFDMIGTLFLALALAAYALAMTLGQGRFGALNMTLLLAAAMAAVCFVLAETKVASPLLRLSMFRTASLSASLAMSTLVSTVIMSTFVVGPFYLSRALGFETEWVGLVMSVGPFVSALTGVPAGWLVDRFGARRITLSGLFCMIMGLCGFSLLQGPFGVAGYIVPLAILTVGYALFQAANNTAIMTGAHVDQRGVISGMLSLSRNLGLITGTAVLGAVFSLASATTDVTTAQPEAVASGMRCTYGVAAILIGVAFAIALGGRVFRPLAALRFGR
jgi:EmrB/QacA subfamily drug resistance transporter